MTNRRKEVILWRLLGLDFALIGLQLLFVLSHSHWADNGILDFLIIVVPFVMMVCHATWTLATRRAAIFIGIAVVIGFCAEMIGTRTGALFSGLYSYPQTGILIAGIPLKVLLFWAVLSYTGYCLSNTLLHWLGQQRPHISRSNKVMLIPLIIFDALAVVAIDLLLDPVAVHAGAWQWHSQGAYFGVPFGNFIGWFFITALITGMFRLYEYTAPRLDIETPTLTILLMPAIGYQALALSLALFALADGLGLVALVGLILTLPIFLANAYVFWHARRL